MVQREPTQRLEASGDTAGRGFVLSARVGKRTFGSQQSFGLFIPVFSCSIMGTHFRVIKT